jgi:hypothetical protein
MLAEIVGVHEDVFSTVPWPNEPVPARLVKTHNFTHRSHTAPPNNPRTNVSTDREAPRRHHNRMSCHKPTGWMADPTEHPRT